MTLPRSSSTTAFACRARRTARAFTLVELMVAMVGGLIVGLAVVGLSREANHTFHEEARAAAAEMSLRSAIERLRADLARASYMSSPNIWSDPHLILDIDRGAGRPAMLRRLAGIRLYDKGSLKMANTAGSTIAGTDDAASGLSASNGLAPDAIDITGNMTTSEIYSVQSTYPGSGSCSGGDRLILDTHNPPAYRLGGATAAGGAELARQFVPVPGAMFLARVLDVEGRTQYVEVCAAGVTGTDLFVDIMGTVKKPSFGGVYINPVVTVRYKIAPTLPPYTQQLQSSATKYDLYRVYVSSSNVEVGTPELIAEYAVDLKFAFTVDDTAISGTPCAKPETYCAPYATVRSTKSLAFDDPDNPGWADDTTGGPAAAKGPQRIRSVRVRLATRTASPDRTVDVPGPAAGYLYRYEMSPNAYARVRTVVTEVALNNQGNAVYP